MTDHPANDQFHASSFMQGHNAEYLEQMYARYANDPASVDAQWAEFFRQLGDADLDVKAKTQGPSWARVDWPPALDDDLHGALTGEYRDEPTPQKTGQKIAAKAAETGVTVSEDQIKHAVLDSLRAMMIIRSYRIRGHLAAELDPLGMRKIEARPELDPASYGFEDADMDRPIYLEGTLGLEFASLREILTILKRTYTGTFALQYMHIADREMCDWLRDRIERKADESLFTREGRKAILNKMVQAEGFEKFLHVKYMGTKRFGLDGGEAVIPALEQIIKRGGALGVKDIIIGMPHRGRLNILANVMGKPYR
ncbi:MAG: 2-oxoglutarate dehydrogenase E1 component, partial [Pseudomonadota bacterium]